MVRSILIVMHAHGHSAEDAAGLLPEQSGPRACLVALNDLGQAYRHAVERDLMRAQWRWPLGMALLHAEAGVVGRVNRTCEQPHHTRLPMHG